MKMHKYKKTQTLQKMILSIANVKTILVCECENIKTSSDRENV